jgi:hypothetical protein
MNPHPTRGPGTDLSPVSLCLLPDFDCSALAGLLNAFCRQGRYAVSLDLCKAPRLGPVEIRTLGAFAEAFQRRGGFLNLQNASENATLFIQVFRFDDLLKPMPALDAAPPPRLSGKVNGDGHADGCALTRTRLAEFRKASP